jgi:hypothetical protein
MRASLAITLLLFALLNIGIGLFWKPAVDVIYKIPHGPKSLNVDISQLSPPETYPDAKTGPAIKYSYSGDETKESSGKIEVTKTDLTTKKPVYHFTANVDSEGQRLLPEGLRTSSDQAKILVLGCSFTFGIGLADDETVSAYLQKKSPFESVHTIARGGWGPNDVLDYVDQHLSEMKDVDYVFYQFIDDHVTRATMPSIVFAMEGGKDWMLDKTNYRITPEGLQKVGKFQDRTFTNLLFDGLSYLPLLSYMHVSFPRLDSNYSLEKTAAIIQKIQQDIQTQSPKAKFVVAIYPYGTEEIAPKFLPHLQKRSLEILNFSEYNFDAATGNRILIPLDGHPTKYTNYILAEKYREYIEQQH